MSTVVIRKKGEERQTAEIIEIKAGKTGNRVVIKTTQGNIWMSKAAAAAAVSALLTQEDESDED